MQLDQQTTKYLLHMSSKSYDSTKIGVNSKQFSPAMNIRQTRSNVAGCVSLFLLDYPKLFGSVVTPHRFHLTVQTPNWWYTEHMTKNKMRNMGDAISGETWVWERTACIPWTCVWKQIQWGWGGGERMGQQWLSVSRRLDGEDGSGPNASLPNGPL